MADHRIPELLPKCLLISVLKKKARRRTDVQFDYLAQLERFRKCVRRDMGYVPLLFTEYTPHDEEYHLRPLFHLASQLLGTRIIQELNATELFLLSCALFGHDWGMAVSDTERRAIIRGIPVEGGSRLPSLDNERARFFNFARERGCTFEKDGVDPPIDLWRDYVRQTHAIRSAERVRKYFETIDTGVALRLSSICESHCLDYEVLRDPVKYPTQGSVLGEVVNIRALAVYLRLADMLDLSDDRTPYAIWKFVSPQDTQSVMEWNKHRVLRRVTFPDYQKGQRCILVDGSTNDHEVHAALEDLRDYCEKQLRGCKDLLAEMLDQKYVLDVSHIEWRIEAVGFKPISVQFQFDREKMLDLVSRELYQGNIYVFLRELLQNSIDAIRMRRKVIQSKEGKCPEDIGEIRVLVEHHSNGVTDITWKDDGIGMDEHIVRNYLAVVGKSYYQSDDFTRLGIDLDPISRFGIGILTCFMVAESIDIVTKKDRNLFPASEPLRIRIPAINRRFRVEVLSNRDIDVGTTIKLSIDQNRISSNAYTADSTYRFDSLGVTNYLRSIAGFVEFPLIIDEGGNKTVILHPYHSVAEARRRFGESYNIEQLNLAYPWEEAVFPEDLPIARQLFREETFDLKKDLDLTDYEGILSYPVPLHTDLDFTDGLPGDSKVTVLSSSRPDLIGKSVRWIPGWKGQIIRERNLFEHETESCQSRHGIYRDGILVPRASFKMSAITKIEYIRPACAHCLVINLPKSRAKDLDLARTLILTNSDQWTSPIFDAHTRVLSEKYSQELSQLPPTQRLFQLASFLVFHNVSLDRLVQILPQDEWPMPFIGRGGNLVLKLWKEVRHDPISRSPEPLSTKLASLIRNLLKGGYPPKPLSCWQGHLSLIDFATWGGTEGESKILTAILEFVRFPLGRSHQLGSLRFLSPPWEGDPPLLQEVWFPKGHFRTFSSSHIEGILEHMSKGLAGAHIVEEVGFQECMFELLGIKGFRVIIASFPSPFNIYFAYGNEALNVQHPAAQALIWLAARVILLGIHKKLPPSQYRIINYLLKRVLFNLPGGITGHEYSEWASLMRDLWSFADKLQLIDHIEVQNLIPKIEEFVPGSLKRFLSVDVRENWDKPFGEVLA
jgi:hypothetical protein